MQPAQSGDSLKTVEIEPEFVFSSTFQREGSEGRGGRTPDIGNHFYT